MLVRCQSDCECGYFLCRGKTPQRCMGFRPLSRSHLPDGVRGMLHCAHTTHQRSVGRSGNECIDTNILGDVVQCGRLHEPDKAAFAGGVRRTMRRCSDQISYIVLDPNIGADIQCLAFVGTDLIFQLTAQILTPTAKDHFPALRRKLNRGRTADARGCLQLALQARGAAASPDSSALKHCARITDELLVDVRGVVSRLRESDGIDLHQALRALDPGLPTPRVVFDLDSEVRVPDIPQAEAMLRCAQEGLTNALRHSGAHEIRVVLTDSPEGLTLTVEDDGTGEYFHVWPALVLFGSLMTLKSVRCTKAGKGWNTGRWPPMGYCSPASVRR